MFYLYGHSMYVSHIAISWLWYTAENGKRLNDCRGKPNTDERLAESIRTELFQFSNKSVVKVKLATIVEGDLKAPFSIATTPRCSGGRYSFPWIAPLYP